MTDTQELLDVERRLLIAKRARLRYDAEDLVRAALTGVPLDEASHRFTAIVVAIDSYDDAPAYAKQYRQVIDATIEDVTDALMVGGFPSYVRADGSEFCREHKIDTLSADNPTRVTSFAHSLLARLRASDLHDLIRRRYLNVALRATDPIRLETSEGRMDWHSVEIDQSLPLLFCGRVDQHDAHAWARHA
jgi:hypothetical protein